MSSTAADRGDSKQPWAIATITSVTALAFISVALRIIARRIRKMPLGLDDYLIVGSMIQLFLVVVFCALMVHFGMGLHADTLPTNNVVLVAKFLLVAEILYAINLAITKISILTMYYRIFPVGHFKMLAYAIGGFCIAWVITIIFVFIFICVPVQKVWYVDLPGHCVNQVATWCSNAASTIATDIAILVLPMPRVWKLNMSKIQRIGLTIAFGLGFFVVFASVYRFTVLFGYNQTDSTYTLTNVVAWTIIEIAVGIISACLPTLRPLVKFVLERFGISTSGTSAEGQSRSAGSRLGFHETGYPSNGASNNARPFRKLDDTQLVPETGAGMANKVIVGSVSSEVSGELSSLDEDDIPLHQIRVKTEIGITKARD